MNLAISNTRYNKRFLDTRQDITNCCQQKSQNKYNQSRVHFNKYRRVKDIK